MRLIITCTSSNICCSLYSILYSRFGTYNFRRDWFKSPKSCLSMELIVIIVINTARRVYISMFYGSFRKLIK